MSSREMRVLAVAALVLTGPAAAQRIGAVDVGVYGRYADFDNSLGLDNAIGFGGRAAVFVQPGVALELDVSHASAGPSGGGSSVPYTPLRFRAVRAIAAGPRIDALLGGGYVHNSYGGSRDAGDGGVSLLLGLRHHTTNSVWVRLGLDLDLMFHTSDTSPFDFYTGNWAFSLGVGTLLNGGGGAR